MFNNIYRNKKVLVTGNTGFKGCWLTTWLLELGAQVYGFSRKCDIKPSFFNELNLVGNIYHVEAEITDLEKVRSVINDIKPDFLFHLAAQAIVSTSYQDPISTFKINGLGTANILEALRHSNHHCSVVIVTSDKCYENQEWIWGYRENEKLGGKDPYSASKSIAEIIVKSYFYSFFSSSNSKIRICSVRSGNVIGGGDWSKDRIIPDCITAWNNNKSVVIRSQYATRPWQHVLDTLNGYLRAGELLHSDSTINGEAFNFGPSLEGQNTVLGLIKELINHWDPENPKPNFTIANEKPFKEAHNLKLNCDKALHILNWKPILSFKDTVRFTANWYNYYYKNPEKVLELTRNQIGEFSNLGN